MNVHHSRISEDPPARNRSRISVGRSAQDVRVLEPLPEQCERRVEPERGDDQGHPRGDLDAHAEASTDSRATRPPIRDLPPIRSRGGFRRSSNDLLHCGCVTSLSRRIPAIRRSPDRHSEDDRSRRPEDGELLPRVDPDDVGAHDPAELKNTGIATIHACQSENLSRSTSPWAIPTNAPWIAPMIASSAHRRLVANHAPHRRPIRRPARRRRDDPFEAHAEASPKHQPLGEADSCTRQRSPISAGAHAVHVDPQRSTPDTPSRDRKKVHPHPDEEGLPLLLVGRVINPGGATSLCQQSRSWRSLRR